MNVFKLEWRSSLKGTLIWTASLCGVIFFLLAFFPSMQTEAMRSLSSAKMEGIDPILLTALGVDKMIDFSIITNYFGYVLQYLALAIMVYATQQASTLLVKEETDGTIAFLFAKPLNRAEIFFQKALCAICLLVLMLSACFVVSVIGYVAYSSLTLGEALRECGVLYAGVLLCALVFMGVGVLVSALVKSSKSATGAAMAIVFGSFVLGISSVLVKGLGFLKYFSPMDWIKPGKLLSAGLTLEEWAIAVALLIICPMAALLFYRKRDFS